MCLIVRKVPGEKGIWIFLFKLGENGKKVSKKQSFFEVTGGGGGGD